MRAVEGNFIFGCKFLYRRGESLPISHLLYVDDTLIFCEANQDQMLYLEWTLMWFGAISGLIINLNKSEIIPVGRVANVAELVAKLGYEGWLSSCQVLRAASWGSQQVFRCLGFH